LGCSKRNSPVALRLSAVPPSVNLATIGIKSG
jgi:hypothetical protein